MQYPNYYVNYFGNPFVGTKVIRYDKKEIDKFEIYLVNDIDFVEGTYFMSKYPTVNYSFLISKDKATFTTISRSLKGKTTSTELWDFASADNEQCLSIGQLDAEKFKEVTIGAICP
jgi:hypothetical protein